MTTLAYKDNIISFDSQVTQGDTILDDAFNKCIRRKGAIFVFCGVMNLYDEVVNEFFNENGEFNDYIGGFIYYKEQLYLFGADKETEFWVQKLDMNKHYACGSGKDHALTAMDMGATAKEAIKMAIKRDVNTGGKVREVKI